ncbi:MAG: hypothetical protein QM783_14915 [Phycisphaerales bacterium]
MQERMNRSESNNGPYPFVLPPSPPSDEARERFARRRAAGRLAELVAQAVGRSNREAGTARVAIKLAIEVDALRQRRETKGKPGTPGKGDRAADDEGRAAMHRAMVIRGSRTPQGTGPKTAG